MRLLVESGGWAPNRPVSPAGGGVGSDGGNPVSMTATGARFSSLATLQNNFAHPECQLGVANGL